MKTTPEIAKAQAEVWEWKEKASEKLNQLSKEERIEYLKKQEEAFLNQMKALKKAEPDASIY
ncbi:MAG: hypothetical protein ICV84_06310 [Flavisolibacter sp.]|nr:hypothetical protein [Flavisolibacter sp.]